MPGIMKYINRISRNSGVVYSSKLCDYGIKQSHHPYILLVCREPGISQEKIAREICINRSSVTRHLAALEEKGLITRSQDSDDRRVWRVYPTEKMQELLPAVRKVMNEWNDYMLEGLTEQESKTLISLLEKMTERSNSAARDALKGKEKQL